MLPFDNFDLKDLDINLDLLKGFFNDLELDGNDKDLYNLAPFRARKILYCKFIDGALHIEENKEFKQNVEDGRKESRVFKKFCPSFIEHLTLEKLITKLCNLYSLRDKLEISFHFVKIFANAQGTSNSPEGIHRDGFDILIPSIVIERENIEGGFSRIFDNGELIYNNQLNEGEGLILNEKDYLEMYHDVTPITLKDLKRKGHRSIIGIDINLI